jgi:hypothetical protein
MTEMTLKRILKSLPNDQKTHTITLKARYDGFRVVIDPLVKVDKEEVEI